MGNTIVIRNKRVCVKSLKTELKQFKNSKIKTSHDDKGV